MGGCDMADVEVVFEKPFWVVQFAAPDEDLFVTLSGRSDTFVSTESIDDALHFADERSAQLVVDGLCVGTTKFLVATPKGSHDPDMS